MICAADSLPSMSWMRPSMKPWRSLAASYSAFSLRSPCGARLGDGIDDPGAVDGLQALQFFAQFLCAALGDRDGGHVRCSRKRNRRTLPFGGRREKKLQTSVRPVSRLRIASGLESGLYCLAAGRCRVCSSMYWPDITACEVWSEKQTQHRPGRERHGLLRRISSGSPGRTSCRRAAAASGGRTRCAATWSRAARAAASPASANRAWRAAGSAAATASNGSPTRQTRGAPCGIDVGEHAQDALAVVGPRGKASTCSRRSSARHDCTRVSTCAGR